jgi:hypothetical protein
MRVREKSAHPRDAVTYILGFWPRDAILAAKMCTPKKLLHRQQALIHAIKKDQPMKIRTPTHHQCCNDARREAQELVEKYAHTLRKSA